MLTDGHEQPPDGEEGEDLSGEEDVSQQASEAGADERGAHNQGRQEPALRTREEVRRIPSPA